MEDGSEGKRYKEVRRGYYYCTVMKDSSQLQNNSNTKIEADTQD